MEVLQAAAAKARENKANPNSARNLRRKQAYFLRQQAGEHRLLYGIWKMDLVSSLKNLLGYWALRATRSSGSVDNWIFALHYKFTSAILIICSITVAIHQFLLNPIRCTSSNYPSNVLDTFCWMLKTFSLPFAWSETDNALSPGKLDESQVYHAYYQWIYFVLFVQAITFYVPGHFWKSMERGRIKKLTSGLGLDYPAIPEETKRINTKLIVKYILSSLHHNGRYFFYFTAAEIMNFINVVGQVYLIDNAFGGEFTTYGLKVIGFSEWVPYKRYDPMVKIFPRLVKCTLHQFGASGAVQRHDAMCALPINEVSEKIYIFLWFWLFILAILSGLALVYRSAVTMSSKVRFFATKSRDTICNADYLKIIVKKFGVGDWFLLDLLAKNVDPQNFKDIVQDLAKELDENPFYLENSNRKKSF
ncbi:Innexin inx2 [Araneus ventricosus]|uniref:Innexin n=1 Tax=Araneus ventricosus TaxID=182803 RepID=A0A4Y2J013_ARAVE|nr:Innexin inx2 [Araneus ventricosus]